MNKKVERNYNGIIKEQGNATLTVESHDLSEKTTLWKMDCWS